MRILASALDLFSKKGYDQTTFTDIAARLKMTKGAVYWHFASKEALLVSLVDAALVRFKHYLKETIPQGELTFPAVAEMMVKIAEAVVADPKSVAFFRLMKCQLRWGDASMSAVRNNLLSNDRFGPKQAIITALDNDIRAGRVRKVDVEEISTVVIAIWDGLVQAKIDGFLECDMVDTLRNAYESIWSRIAASNRSARDSRARHPDVSARGSRALRV